MKLYLGDILDSTIKYDGKKYTWIHIYEKAYADNFSQHSFSDYKFLNKRYQLYTKFRYNNHESLEMCFSGDIIFNFFDSSARGKRRLYSEMKYILENDLKNTKDDSQKRKIQNTLHMLEDCKDRTETKANVSIFPSTGGLQFVKQSVGRDRFDTFLWCINEHYNGNSLLFNHCAAANIPQLRSFLKLFENVYEFCYCLYNLDEDDNDLISELIKSGS